MADHFYVYPAYLARGLSRADGRRVAEPTTMKDVTVDAIAQAAKRLGYRVEVEVEKQYPRLVPSYGGRVKVTKKGGVSKSQFLRLVAAELAKLPPTGGPH